MKNYVYLTLFLLSICYSNLGATDKYSIQTEYKYVSAKSGLNFRDKPKGDVLGKFTFGQKVGVIEHSKVFETITDDNKQKKGEWVGIQQGSEIVYVFDAYLSVTNPYVYEILLPISYRSLDLDNPVDYMNVNWFDLHKKNEGYFLEKAKYSVEDGYDECVGVAIKTINTENETLIYINNSSLNSGPVESLTFTQNPIWPKDKFNFSYNNDLYVFHAEGDILSSKTPSSEGIFHDVENYKLYLSINEKPQFLLLEQKYVIGAFIKFLFVGDIDSDGILDFIFEGDRFEEERVILLLSSTAEKDEKYHVSEISSVFDC